MEIGCAGGNFLFYVKTLIAPEFECIGEDFSHSAIEAANNRAGLDCVNFQCVDILENPIQKDYGIICVFEVLEHIEEGQNFKILDNMLDHCEYLIISVPTTKDSCFGEHISHYNWDTFEKNNYNVLWKARLDKIDMSNIGDNGDYFHFITLIHGKLWYFFINNENKYTIKDIANIFNISIYEIKNIITRYNKFGFEKY